MRTFIHLLTCFLLFQAYSATAQKSPVLYEPGHEASLDVTNTVVLRWKAAEIPDAKEISYKVQIFDIGIGQMVQIKGSPVTFMNTQTPVLEVVQKKGLAVAWTVPEKAVGRKYQWRVITLVNGQPRNFEMEMGNQFYINSLTIKTDEVNKTITAENNNNPPGKPKAPAQQKDTVPAKPQSENTISYTRPVLHFPNQGASIKVTAINNLQFSWYPISPKPKQAVTYRWFVFEMKAGRSATDIVQDASPVLKGNVKGVTDVTLNLRANAPGKTYVWTVQAVNDAGVAYGDNNGYADPFVFSVQSAGKVTGPTDPGPGVMRDGGCQIDFNILTKECIGYTPDKKRIYRFTASLKDITSVPNREMSYNNPYTFSCGNNTLTGCTSITLADLLKSTSGTILPIGIFPAIISKTSPDIISWDLVANSSITTVDFSVYAICKKNDDGKASGSAQDNETVSLPLCPCDFCTDDKIRVSEQPGLSVKNNTLMHSVDISIPGVQVKQLKAEIIGFGYYAMSGEKLEGQCYVCNNDDKTFGNFTSGTINALWTDMPNGAFPVVTTGNTHHTLGWWGNPTSINNKKMILNISLPPISTLSCCQGYYAYCIRYTFTDSECRTCSVVRCYQYPGDGNKSKKKGLGL